MRDTLSRLNLCDGVAAAGAGGAAGVRQQGGGPRLQNQPRRPVPRRQAVSSSSSHLK